ncbi:MAG: hypothetical protein IJS82_06960 [Paludibacteraceae bacterium]|nr:hypothetical protein [Paludibacteraceae bacterium]
MRRFRRLNSVWLIAVLLCLSACEDSGFRRSVPIYPVRVVMNTYLEFTDFKESSFTDYVIVTPQGYFRKGKTTAVKPLLSGEACGYGGVVTYVTTNGYEAFDLACPYCAGRGQKCPCEIDGIFAICPNCGEEYDLAAGIASPRKGISRESMLKLNVLFSGGTITVTQRQ